MIDHGVTSANELLARLRSLAAQAEGRVDPSPPETGANDFSALLRNSLEQVNAAQQDASRVGSAFELGDPNTSVADVMIAIQKSNLSFQATTQVRNKLVAAYQEIMSMQI
jgi:flagellar hook-basal body complex protein FliE